VGWQWLAGGGKRVGGMSGKRVDDFVTWVSECSSEKCCVVAHWQCSRGNRRRGGGRERSALLAGGIGGIQLQGCAEWREWEVLCVLCHDMAWCAHIWESRRSSGQHPKGS
jgi:hypothetical protein